MRFDFEVPQEDSYTIWVWWPKGDDRATDTPFTISYGDDALTVNVDQRSNGNQWYELATVYLEEDDFVEAVQEFMHTYYIRKVWAKSQEKSAMPAALKLFMRYLDEKGIVGGTQRIVEIIESEQDTFLRNLTLYTDPSLGGKILPFRSRRK